jgi:hypothetical protein
MGRNNNRNSSILNIGGNSSILNIGGNSSNNNSNQYQYNPNLLFRPNSLWDPDSLLSVPSRQPPQQGHKCRDGKTPLDRFNNRRCRNPDTKIKYPYMRQKLKNRLSSLSIDNTDGYLKWVWPYRKTPRGNYDINNRYKVVKRPDLNGIPRFSINHYLKQNCAATAITTTLPRLLKNKDGKIYFSGTRLAPKQANLDWKRKIVAERIGKLPKEQREQVCQKIKANYVERNNTNGWSELYTNAKLKEMYATYMREKRQGPLDLIQQLLSQPNTFDDYYKKGLYTVAKKYRGPAALLLKDMGDTEGWGNLTGNSRRVSRTKQYKMMKAYIEENDTQALNLNPSSTQGRATSANNLINSEALDQLLSMSSQELNQFLAGAWAMEPTTT